MLLRRNSSLPSAPKCQSAAPVPLFADYDPVNLDWIDGTPALLDVASCYLQPQVRKTRRGQKSKSSITTRGSGKSANASQYSIGSFGRRPAPKLENDEGKQLHQDADDEHDAGRDEGREKEEVVIDSTEATGRTTCTLPRIAAHTASGQDGHNLPADSHVASAAAVDLGQGVRLPQMQSNVPRSMSPDSGADDLEARSSAWTVCTDASQVSSLRPSHDTSRRRGASSMHQNFGPPSSRANKLQRMLRRRRFKAAVPRDPLAGPGKPAILNALALPNMEILCRESVQAAFDTLGTRETTHTWRRMHIDRNERSTCRQQAAQWRVMKASRDRQLEERRRATIEEVECQTSETDEEEVLTHNGKEVKWEKILFRLEARAHKQTDLVENGDAQGAQSSSRGASPVTRSESLAAPSEPATPAIRSLAMKRLAYAQPQLSKKSRADMRVETAKKAKRELKRIEMLTQRHAEAVATFNALPAEDRERLADVFTRNSLPESESYANAVGLTDALAECGICGMGVEDRSALQRFCRSVLEGQRRHQGQWVADVNEFVAHVMPAAKTWLHNVRRSKLLEGLQRCKTTWEGQLELEQAYDSVHALLPHDMKPVLEQSEAIFETWISATDVLRQVTIKFVSGETDADKLLEAAEQQIESLHLAYSREQRKVQERYKLDITTFRDFRSELIFMDNLFRSVDTDGSGTVDREESMQLCSELGLLPRGAKDWGTQIASIMDEDDQLEFARFLDVVVEIRERVERQLESRLSIVARQYQHQDQPALGTKALSFFHESDGPGLERLLSTAAASNSFSRTAPSGGSLRRESTEDVHIAREDLPHLLDDMGIAPQSPSEQAVFDSVLQAHSSDHLTFDNLLKLCAQAQEAVLMQKARAELELAQKLLFSPAELGRLRMLFSQVDIDGSGVLEADSAHKAMNRLGLGKLEFEGIFKLAFHIINIDGSGIIHFQDFMRLVKMARDADGPFSSGLHQTRHLTELGREDLELILACFRIPWAETEVMSDTKMVQKAASLLNISPGDHLYDALHVKSLPDLYQCAKATCEACEAEGKEEDKSEMWHA